jgi:DNA repair protein RadC
MRTYLREAIVTYRRNGKLPEGVRRRVSTSRDVAPVVQQLIGARMTESFLVLALSAKHEIVGFHEVARGGVASCPVVVADVFRYPIACGALGIILAHNHPSGDRTPSPEDLAITRKLLEASRLLGIGLLDHIIVGEDGYTSFLDDGLLGTGFA